MHKNKRPADISVVFECLSDVFNLPVANTTCRRVFGVQAEEEDIVINEVIIASSEAFLPFFGHYFVADIVISRHIKEGHPQFIH